MVLKHKTLFFCLVLFTLCLWGTAYADTMGRYISCPALKPQGAIKAYLDTQTIEVTGQRVSFWIMKVYHDEYAKKFQKQYGYIAPIKYDLDCIQVDIHSREIRSLALACYAADDTVVATSNKPDEWVIPIPESIGERLYFLGEELIKIETKK